MTLHCQDEISIKSLRTYDNTVYTGLQCFLPVDHRYRGMKDPFDGKEERKGSIHLLALKFMNR